MHRLMLWRCRLAVCIAAIFASTASAESPAELGSYWLLLHDRAVVEELKLAPQQRAKMLSVLDPLDLVVLSHRNRPADESGPVFVKAVGEARSQLEKVLSAAQRQRLAELRMRKEGVKALLRADVAAEMKFSDEQKSQIAAVIDDTAKAAAELQKSVQSAKISPTDAAKKSAELQIDQQKQILALLKSEQQTAWRTMVGPPFDPDQFGSTAFKAPAIVGEPAAWLNSQPLDMAKLRGQVVVVHFFAFGCINCIHNYPSYRTWQTELAGKGVTLIGIHTPETTAERSVASLRQKLTENELTFPVVVDNAQTNWNAWGNNVWPAVYLIDKQGYVRHYWAGELNWQGNNGEKTVRGWIEKLMAE